VRPKKKSSSPTPPPRHLTPFPKVCSLNPLIHTPVPSLSPLCSCPANQSLRTSDRSSHTPTCLPQASPHLRSKCLHQLPAGLFLSQFSSRFCAHILRALTGAWYCFHVQNKSDLEQSLKAQVNHVTSAFPSLLLLAAGMGWLLTLSILLHL
jgi:hypothetical protein